MYRSMPPRRRDHRNHRHDADDVPEQSQEGAQLVGEERAIGDTHTL
jgi:hypothetical protein